MYFLLIVSPNGRPHKDRSRQPQPLPDFIGMDDASLLLEDDTLCELARSSYHTGLDGAPCWSASDLADQVELGGGEP